MHPAQHKRSDHQRRFTSDEIRRFDRDLTRSSVSLQMGPPLAGRTFVLGEEMAVPETARRMAAVFVSRAKDGHEDTTNLDLVREGFTERDVIKHFDEATALAGEQLRDVDVNDDRVEYDREARVMVGANAVAGLLLKDTGAVHTACRLAGMQTAEIGNLFPDIIGEALRLVREARATVMVA